MNSTSGGSSLGIGHELLWYEIEGLLGRGGFGLTYLARDKNLDRRVAIKEYLPTMFAQRRADLTVTPLTGSQGENFAWGLRSFLREAQTLAKFKHKNIVQVQTVFESYGTAYMVMEYEQGDNLATLMQAQQAVLDQVFFENILFPVIDGLQHIHNAGFIHRDIKPANIYIRDDGSPVLIDFGSARETSVQNTGEMTSLVSQGYTPLEQYSPNYGSQGPWTDIYALAASVYHAVTGKMAVDALNRSAAAQMRKHDPLQPFSDVAGPQFSASFCQAIDAAMQLQAEHRPQTLSEWQSMFEVGVARANQSSAASQQQPPESTGDYVELPSPDKGQPANSEPPAPAPDQTVLLPLGASRGGPQETSEPPVNTDHATPPQADEEDKTLVLPLSAGGQPVPSADGDDATLVMPLGSADKPAAHSDSADDATLVMPLGAKGDSAAPASAQDKTVVRPLSPTRGSAPPQNTAEAKTRLVPPGRGENANLGLSGSGQLGSGQSGSDQSKSDPPIPEDKTQVRPLKASAGSTLHTDRTDEKTVVLPQGRAAQAKPSKPGFQTAGDLRPRQAEIAMASPESADLAAGRKNWFVPAAVVALVLAAGAGGGFWYLHNQPDTVGGEQASSTSTPTDTAGSQQPVLETSSRVTTEPIPNASQTEAGVASSSLALEKISALPKPAVPQTVVSPIQRVRSELENLQRIGTAYRAALTLDENSQAAQQGIQYAKVRYLRLAELAVIRSNNDLRKAIAAGLESLVVGDERIDKIVTLFQSDAELSLSQIQSLLDKVSLSAEEHEKLVYGIAALSTVDRNKLAEVQAYQQLVAKMKTAIAKKLQNSQFGTAARMLEIAMLVAPADAELLAVRDYLVE